METVSDVVNSTSAPAPEVDGGVDSFELALGILALLFLIIDCSACAQCDPDCYAPGPSGSYIRGDPPPNREPV